jgi:sulfopyruvate decarboxylase alpha subunit
MQETWPDDIHRVLLDAQIRQVVYVPDSAHTRLIELAREDARMEATVLTTEEEGIGMLCGAWLGGERGVLLMQSSGVGNCINTLSLVRNCQFPFLALVTMRGEWGEFNPWQNPMGSVTGQALEMMGVRVHRVDQAGEAGETVAAAADMVFNGDSAAAVLFSQRMIGKKEWDK